MELFHSLSEFSHSPFNNSPVRKVREENVIQILSRVRPDSAVGLSLFYI